MKNYLIVFCSLIFLSEFTFASAYRVTMGLSLLSKDKQEFSLIVQEGQTGTISQELNGEKTSIEVTPEKFLEDDGITTVSLTMQLVKISSDGVRTIQVSPRIVTFLNEKSEISQTDESGKNIYSLSVVASEMSASEVK